MDHLVQYLFGCLAYALEEVFRLRAENDELKLMAFHDPLTGIKNRRWFNEIIRQVTSLAQRTGKLFCLCIIDIDRFKRINDEHGHPVGDAVLVHIANVLQQHIRASDYVARWGGEEFILLLPETSIEDAGVLVERVRRRIEGSSIDVNGVLLAVTASFGLAESSDAKNSDALIKRADKALYEAKASGRNRVCT